MQDVLDQLQQSTTQQLPTLLAALAILVFGWIAAALLSSGVRFVLHRTTLDNKLAAWLSRGEGEKPIPVEDWSARGIFYLVMLFVLVAFFQQLGLTLMVQPVNQLLTQIFDFAPRLVGAGLLMLLAWILAKLAYMAVGSLGKRARIDERLGGQVSEEDGRSVPFSATLAEVVYWLILLLFLPAVLEALALEELLRPVQGMLSKVLAYLPNIFTAGLILAVGWFMARIIQRVVANLAAAVGADRLSEKAGLEVALGSRRLSGLLGLLVYVLVLVPTVIAAMDALALEAITAPASNMLDRFLAAIPSIFAAVLIVGIAWVVARMISGLVSSLLAAAGFDRLPVHLGLAKAVEEGRPRMSQIAGTLVMVGLVFFAGIEAFRLLGFAALADLMVKFAEFAGHGLLGVAIFGLGLYLANLAARSIEASQAGQSRLLAMAARTAILALAAAMALGEIGVAEQIISLTFGIILGALALAMAIALGLGGRDLAGSQLESWFRSIKSDKP